MTQNPNCKNHLNRKALSFCHHCHEYFCFECLNEGPEYYYCNSPQCLKVFEAEKRHEKPEKNDTTPEDTEQRLMVVARYGNVTEAELARTKLESEGIEAYLADQQMGSSFPGINVAFGGVKLKTKFSQAKRASQILGIKK